MLQQFSNVALTVLEVATPLALLGVLLWLFVMYYKKIGELIGNTFKKIDLSKTSTRFRIGVLICMTMSVVHGSYLFNNLRDDIVLDILLAATYDVTTWAMIEGLIKCRKRGNIAASWGLLLAIVAVSGLSFWANITYNRQFYNANAFNHVVGFTIVFWKFTIDGTSDTVKSIITLAQSSPSLMIILMSLVAELFVRSNDTEEEISRKDRFKKFFMRKVDKMEARLEAKKKENEVKKQYEEIENGIIEGEEKQPIMIQPIKWSFLGFKVYSQPVVQPITIDGLDTKQLKEVITKITTFEAHDNTQVLQDAIHKISVSVLHLEQNYNNINQLVAQPQQVIDTQQITEELQRISFTILNLENKVNQANQVVISPIQEPVLLDNPKDNTIIDEAFPTTNNKTVKRSVDTEELQKLSTPITQVPIVQEPVEEIIKVDADKFFSQFSK